MFSKILRSTGAMIAALVMAAPSMAQSSVDIGLFRVGNELEVRLRPTSDFDGIVSNVVFNVRWKTAEGVSLGALRQTGPEQVYIPMQRSGGVHEQGLYSYQIFAGFGMERISSSEQLTWRSGQEYVIARIPFTGNADFSLASDQWSKSITNNAEYYVSLGGQDMTGIIYKSLENITDQVPFSISPNPSRGEFTITMPVTPGEDLWFEITNAAGQVVYTERPNTNGEGFRKDMDLKGEGAGVYMLRIYRNNETETHRIVLNF